MNILAGIVSILLVATSTVSANEQLKFGDFTIYVPADVSRVRGILLALGGPDTRAFISDGRFGAPSPEVEESLHILGKELRKLAADQGLAVLGTSRSRIPNDRSSDELILKAIHEASAKIGRNELANAPLLLYGLSGGTPEAIGFTARNPERVAALLLKVTAIPERLKTAEALAIPTFIVLAEHDTISDNKAVIAVFKANREAGALWALAVEPDVPHHSLSPSQRAITIHWLREIVKLRLGEPTIPLRDVAESSGWLGDSTNGVTSWANFRGDRKSSSWFPSKATAEEWIVFVSSRNKNAQ